MSPTQVPPSYSSVRDRVDSPMQRALACRKRAVQSYRIRTRQVYTGLRKVLDVVERRRKFTETGQPCLTVETCTNTLDQRIHEQARSQIFQDIHK